MTTREKGPMPLSRDAVRAAPYSFRPPSPPLIHVPMLQRPSDEGAAIRRLVPSLQHTDPTQLTGSDLSIITGNAARIATDRTASWTYEQRRQAQPILDFLYLGPFSVARDPDFLQREAITMVLVARDARMAGTSLLSVQRATATLGIAPRYMDIDPLLGIIHAFPDAVAAINHHLLALYHAPGPSRGKVLVACESGNDRSAGIVAAYIMAVFGNGAVPTMQFISVQRFCCSFDEDMKRTLQTWEDILRARRTVALETQCLGARAKRRLDDVVAMDQDDAAADVDRFLDRDPFAPFFDAAP